MKRFHALFLCVGVAACRPSDGGFDPLMTTVAQGPEKLSSLDVEVTFEPNGSGCVALDNGKLPAPAVAGDYCIPSLGTPRDPLLYQSGRKTRANVTVTAVGSKGTRPFRVSGNIALSASVGRIVSGTPTFMENGVAQSQRVIFMNTPGRVQIWAEAGTLMRNENGDQLSPTFSGGASEAIYMGEPTLEDIQRTEDDAVSPLDGQRVEVQGDFLMVTRVGGNGFTVQDMARPLDSNGRPTWNGLFVFAFNGVEGLSVGSRLLKLRGAVTGFQGMTQLAEPEFVAAGGECAPKEVASRYGREPLETEESGIAYRSRCPANAECRDDHCVPVNETFHYDRFGRVTCHNANACGTASNECPAGTACLDRADWRSVDENGQSAFTCQACPTEVHAAGETQPIWTASCFPIYKGEQNQAAKLRNETLEGTLLKVSNPKVEGLDLTDDFTRSGFQSFGQWKLKLPDGTCATVTSEAAPDFDVVTANTARTPLQSFTGTLRQVRFSTGSAFWMLDLRHKDDLVR